MAALVVGSALLAGNAQAQGKRIVGWGNNDYGQAAAPVGKVAAGAHHSLALKADGTVVAWGLDDQGQIAVPSDATNVVAVASGWLHSLALRGDGAVVAWGDNGFGQAVVPDGAESNVIAIAAAGDHSLALKSDGTVVGWGQDGSGQASGAGTRNDLVAVAAGYGFSLAVTTARTVAGWGNDGSGQVTGGAGLTDVVAVAAGGDHGLALTGDGRVHAWGKNDDGQATAPAEAVDVVAIAAGVNHSLALKFDGTVVAWGKNDSGQTIVPAEATDVVAIAAGLYHCLAVKGDGTVIAWGGNVHGQSSVPAGLDTKLKDVRAVAAGSVHSVAVRPDGTVVAWGYNASGQATVPVGLKDVVDVASRHAHNLALKSGGEVVAWGSNNYGQSTVPDTAKSNVVAVSAGIDHSLALKSDGTVITWGRNLGQGLASGERALAASAGGYHNLALKSGGEVVAWGYDTYGQATVPEAAKSNVVAVAGGLYHSLALKNDGTVIAWGGNVSGQGVVPPEIYQGAPIVAIAAGWDHNLALRSDGTVFGWGLGTSGQTSIPPDLTNVLALSGGLYHSLALTPQPVTLTVTRAGSGSGAVTSSPVGINCGAACQHDFATGATVELTPVPDGSSVFTGWTGACSGSGVPCKVTMNVAKTVEATFQPSTEKVTVSFLGTGGGSVVGTVPSAGGPLTVLDCSTMVAKGSCTANVAYGAVVTMTATPKESVFSGWSTTCAGTGTCTFTVNSPKTVGARFDPSGNALTVNLSNKTSTERTPSGTYSTRVSSGTVTVTPADAPSTKLVECRTATCRTTVGKDLLVSILAEPDPGSVFTGWTGTYCRSSSPNPCTVKMDMDKAVTANFNLSTYPLSVTLSGAGTGTVTGGPINCPSGTCSADLAYRTSVTLAVTLPADGKSIFKGWTGACSGTGACTVSMTSAKAVDARFDKASYQLNVLYQGSKAGTVSGKMVPAGSTSEVALPLSCDSNGCTASVPNGAKVILSASPNAGGTFGGWAVSCTGTGTCSINQMNGDKTVWATFQGGAVAAPSCGGTCSVSQAACRFDGNCPTGETCIAPTPRFVDNGNGTVSDRRTCLVWEKKTGTIGTPVTCSLETSCNDPHDVNNAYSAMTFFGVGRQGDALLVALNGAAFGGYTDWRLPTSAGGAHPTAQDPELESILTAFPECNGSPCIDAVFGPTAPDFYVASPPLPDLFPRHAPLVHFDSGTVGDTARCWGYATGGTTTTLVDSAQAFPPQAAGSWVAMESGANQGMTRLITANTATSISFAAVVTSVVRGVRYEVIDPNRGFFFRAVRGP